MKEVENLRFSPISFQGAFSILVLSLSEYKVHLRVENENPASKMPVSFLSSAEFCADRKARELNENGSICFHLMEEVENLRFSSFSISKCFPIPVLALSEYVYTPSGREREFCI